MTTYRTMTADGELVVLAKEEAARAEAQRTANALKRPVAVEWLGNDGGVEVVHVQQPAARKRASAVSKRLMDEVSYLMQWQGMTYEDACAEVATRQTARWIGPAVDE